MANAYMDIKHKNDCDSQKLNLVDLAVCILAVKLVIFLIDPTVMFFLGDSARYIDTAVSSYIPPDRSFLYGFLIRWLTYSSQSLTSLVFFQVLCSSASAVLAGYILNRYSSASPAVSVVTSLLCATAPLQLMFERYVLAETISLLLFALLVATALHHVKHPQIKTLFLLSLSGVILIAFRLSFLPLVLIAAVIVPGLAAWDPRGRWNGNNTEASETKTDGGSKRVVTACFHILISCVLTLGFHQGYKLINGKLSGNAPAYQYSTGFHLIASWAPLLENGDFSDPGVAAYGQYYFRFDLKDRFQRINHRWSSYGLVGYLIRFYDSRIKAERAAYETAMKILQKNHFKIIRLAFTSYMDYWNVALLRENLQLDRSAREYPTEFMQILKSQYHLYGEGRGLQKTLTNQYFFNAIPWFMVILSLPLVMAVVMVIDKGRNLISLALLGGFGLLILINATALIHRNTMRFFHPEEWITLIFLGVFFDGILKKWAGSHKNLRDKKRKRYGKYLFRWLQLN